MTEAMVPERMVELRGAPLELLEQIENYTGPREVREYLIEGPGGSGKSRGVGEVLHWLGMTYPGIRILVVRKWRRSLTQSFLQTWEDEIIGVGDPMLQGSARLNRSNYLFKPIDWEGKPTEVVLAGLDDPENLFSTNYDVVYAQQTEQLDLSTWSRFRRATRNFGHPDLRLQLMIADVNPAEPTHWLNTRASKGDMIRLVSYHTDNPRWYMLDAEGKLHKTERGHAYIDGLRKMPEGPDKERLYYGRWSARAGLVWSNYRANIHEIERPSDLSTLGIKWYCGSMDWGYQHPGVLQVWGVDGDNRAYRVAEWYRTGKTLDYWADRVTEACKEFTPFRGIVADPSRPDAIDAMNTRLGLEGLPHYVREANNKKTKAGAGDFSGLDLVRDKLAIQGDGRPAMFFVKGSTRDRDEGLVNEGLPWCAEMEVWQYTYELNDDGKPTGENTDKDCRDDAMDATRYAECFIWTKDLSEPVHVPKFAPGTLGQKLGHEAVMRKGARYIRA